MKKVWKYVLAALFAAVLAMTASSCSCNDQKSGAAGSLVGKWTVDTDAMYKDASSNERITIGEAKAKANEILGSNFSAVYTFGSDGRYSLTGNLSGNSMSDSGTYTAVDGQLTIVPEKQPDTGNSTVSLSTGQTERMTKVCSYRIEDGKLHMDIELYGSSIRLIFNKSN